jgi:hypothetical protein
MSKILIMIISNKKQKIHKNEELTICFDDKYIFDDKNKRNTKILDERHLHLKCHARETDNVFPNVFFHEKIAQNISQKFTGSRTP